MDREWDSTLTTQLFAHQGFVVLELDNRGMANRGKRFGTALYLHMGGVEVKDQVAGVEYLKASCPYVDPTRVGVFGWSYGGYMALRMHDAGRKRVLRRSCRGAGHGLAPLRHALYRAVHGPSAGQCRWLPGRARC